MNCPYNGTPPIDVGCQGTGLAVSPAPHSREELFAPHPLGSRHDSFTGARIGSVPSPLGRGGPQGRGGFPPAWSGRRTHPAAPRHKEEACPPTATHMLDTFPLSLQGGDGCCIGHDSATPRPPAPCRSVPGGQECGLPARKRPRWPRSQEKRGASEGGNRSRRGNPCGCPAPTAVP